jgi:hypothetical protein
MMKRIVTLTAVALAVLSSTAMAASLTAMPFEGTGTSSEARAITPDGKYVAGISNGKGVAWNISGGTTTAIVAGGTWAFTQAVGIDYATSGGNKYLVAHGLSSGWSSTATSTDGVTWTKGVRASNVAPVIDAANTLRTASSAADSWYVTSMSASTGNTSTLYVEKQTYPTTLVSRDSKGVTQKSSIQGVSGTGLGVARRKGDGTNYWNYKCQYQGTGGLAASYFNGLAGDSRGEAWAISTDGAKIFGVSPVLGGRTGIWPYVYNVAGATTSELPTLPGTAGSTSNAYVYGTNADGTLAVGHNYLGAESAVLWYLDKNGWQVIDLTAWASAHGVLGDFTRLTRGYSVGVDKSTDEVVIAGIGGNSLGQTQGFALRMYVPEPATLAFLSLGGLALLRRRR